MKTYKSLNLRWIASTVQLCPWTQKQVLPVLRASAKAAVAQCTGGANGRMCGIGWWSEDTPSHTTEFDGNTGLGQEMAALSALMAVLLVEERNMLETSALVESRPGRVSNSHAGSKSEPESESRGFTMATLPKPVTHNTGGTSVGDVRAGERLGPKLGDFRPLTQADIVGASILTALMIIGIFGMLMCICTDRLESGKPCKRSDRERPDTWCGLSCRTDDEESLVKPRKPAQHSRVLALSGKQKAKTAGNSVPASKHSQHQNRPTHRDATSQAVEKRRRRRLSTSRPSASKPGGLGQVMAPSPLARTWGDCRSEDSG